MYLKILRAAELEPDSVKQLFLPRFMAEYTENLV